MDHSGLWNQSPELKSPVLLTCSPAGSKVPPVWKPGPLGKPGYHDAHPTELRKDWMGLCKGSTQNRGGTVQMTPVPAVSILGSALELLTAEIYTRPTCTGKNQPHPEAALPLPWAPGRGAPGPRNAPPDRTLFAWGLWPADRPNAIHEGCSGPRGVSSVHREAETDSHAGGT